MLSSPTADALTRTSMPFERGEFTLEVDELSIGADELFDEQHAPEVKRFLGMAQAAC